MDLKFFVKNSGRITDLPIIVITSPSTPQEPYSGVEKLIELDHALFCENCHSEDPDKVLVAFELTMTPPSHPLPCSVVEVQLFYHMVEHVPVKEMKW